MIPLPVGPFDILLADPAWRYRFAVGYGRSVEAHYSTMADDEIAAMPVAALGHDASILFLWATAPKLVEALDVMRAWGFQYVTNGVWDKRRLGMGNWFRIRHEHLLIGRRAKSRTTPIEHRRTSIFAVKKTRLHSEKPLAVYEWIERAWPSASKVELFSRRERAGWTSWGNEVELPLLV